MEEKQQQLNIWITQSKHRRLKALCAAEGRSIREVIEKLIDMQIAQRERELSVKP